MRKTIPVERDEGLDSSLGTVCFNPIVGSRPPTDDPDEIVFPSQFVEVCLRCGLQYHGSLQETINIRRAHVCDPGKRQGRRVPRWALKGRKRR